MAPVATEDSIHKDQTRLSGINHSRLLAQAVNLLNQPSDGKRPVFAGVAPGRLTLIGEHVDYVGGKTACVAIGLHIAVASRRSSGGWRVRSGQRVVERQEPSMCGDIGDRVFAACLAASEVIGEDSAMELAVVADLPEAVGLSSSAAVTCATIISRFLAARRPITARQLIDLAIHAEREIAGIPCGDMDQWAVVASRKDHVTIFDAYKREASFVRWPWRDIRLVVVHTGAAHDNAGAGYRSRRREAEAVLETFAIGSVQEMGDRWPEIGSKPLRRRARHLSTEVARVEAAIKALREEDSVLLGQLISQSHTSLAQDYEVSTPLLDAVVQAAQGCEGCLGARMVGGGFGGSVLALCQAATASTIRDAMVRATGREGVKESWIVTPSSGAIPN